MAPDRSPLEPSPVWPGRMAQWLAAQGCQGPPPRPAPTDGSAEDEMTILVPEAWPRVLPGL